MRSKIILYAGIVVAVIVVGALVWYFVFSGSGGTTTTTQTGQTGTLPSAGNQTGAGTNGGTASGGGASSSAGTSVTQGLPNGSASFGILSNEPVFDYFVDAQNNVTVVEPNGEIARIANGQPTFLSSNPVQSVLSAGFSYDGSKAFVSFGDPANPQTSIFDIATQAWTPLPVGILSPVWSPVDHRLAYMTNANGALNVFTLDPTKASNKPVAVTSVTATDLALSWPNKNDLILSDKPSIYADGSIWLYDLTKKTLTNEVYAQFGVESVWSNATTTTGLVLSSLNYGRNGSLALMNSASSSSQPLTLNTLPSKCAFGPQVGTSSPATLALYCAVPANASFLSAALPDDYQKMVLFTADDFYKIDLSSGATSNLLTPVGSIDGSDLKVLNKILFFVNRYDNKLYAISLSGG